MGKAPPFITKCSTWRTGRWFLLPSILLLLFCLFSPELILRHIISPQADFSRNGWWMHFYEPSHPVGVEGYEVFLPGGKIIALNPDFKKARGYLLWDAPVSGPYCFKLETDDDGVLAVDGKNIATMIPNHPDRQRVDTWIKLTQGVHLFQIRTSKDAGGGGFSVGLMTPPRMNSRILEGNDVAVPTLGNIDTWWGILAIAHYGLGAAWIIASFFTLCLLLPLTVNNRPLSVLTTLGIALGPALFLPVSVQREPYIGEMVQQELQEQNPDFVFIGNSMLWSRIDDAYLGQLLGGEKVYSIVNFGGLSAVHYLSFKYLFSPANIHPKKVFIFFRRNQFILPRARTNDPFVKKIIERLTPVPDPLFEQIIHGRSRSMTDVVYDNILNLFPVAAAQPQIRKKLSGLAVSLTSIGELSDGISMSAQPTILNLVHKRFSFTSSSLRPELEMESQQETTVKNAYDFYGRVEDSFLPPILALAEKKDISLVFVRVQERPTPKGAVPDAPELQTYMQDLGEYLKLHNAALYDFTGDPELPLSAYHDGDHIKDQKKYTELFSRRMRAFLQ